MTTPPSSLTRLREKHALSKQYLGKKVADLPTPSYLVERSKFQRNCERMLCSARRLNAPFRAHIKTHKTLEGTSLQLGVNTDSEYKTDRIVISTLQEGWGILPLVKQGLISDVHYSLPVVKSRLAELELYSFEVPHLRLMVDDIGQLEMLVQYSKEESKLAIRWSVFVKIDMGTKRAGLTYDSQELKDLLDQLLNSEAKDYVSLYGFYCHAGHSYGSGDKAEATNFLLQEIENANNAARVAKKIDDTLQLVLSVGATPTAHASAEWEAPDLGQLAGVLELHAGNYPCCDLQQVATNCVTLDDVSAYVLAEVVSHYLNRNNKTPGEQLINAGVIALAREFSSIPGHGVIVDPSTYGDWIVGKLSQEHGILFPSEEGSNCEFIPLGTKIKIVPQHNCIAAAAFPWYFVIEEDTVVDIWVPFHGW
ncbi:BA75_00187T0 [Komagataella pastoris]|uniref:D-serine dehydratase n=1 Tax=Komagataella pastoris TaxID=4922 RepID=A0A1B2J9B1_PICPA|nr:BA75_00187T0 [Komagataella pastoris]